MQEVSMQKEYKIGISSHTVTTRSFSLLEKQTCQAISFVLVLKFVIFLKKMLTLQEFFRIFVFWII